MDLISICIPTYNSEKYIEECINSVLIQTYENIEIIISDNNSEDDTIEIIKKMKLNNLKLHKNKINLGMVENFNIVSKLATGKYIKFLSSDDKLNKNSLEKSINAFHQNENVVLVSTAKSIIDLNSNIIFKKISNLNTGIYKGSKITKKILYSSRNPVGEPSASLIKREAFEKVGGFKSPFPMTLDIDFWISVLKYGDFFFIDEPLVSFRIHKNSYSVLNIAGKEYSDWIKIKLEEGHINKIQSCYILLKFKIIKNIKNLVYFLKVK